MIRILVTGSTGIMGRHVMRLLAERDPLVEIICFQGDLTNSENVKRQMDRIEQLDAVIHLAALVPVGQVEKDPARAYGVNVGGTVNLLGAVHSVGLSPHVFHCSTGHVYAPSESPLTESSPAEPHSLYGRTKWMAEIAATDICKAAGLSLCIGRLFSIHDPEQTGAYLRPAMEKRLANEDLSQPFLIRGADSTRDFLKASEAAEIALRLTLGRVNGVVNIGSGQGTRVADFVQMLANRTLDVRKEGPVNHLVADTTRLQEVLPKCP